MANRLSQLSEAITASGTPNVRLSQIEEALVVAGAPNVRLSQARQAVVTDATYTHNLLSQVNQAVVTDATYTHNLLSQVNQAVVVASYSTTHVRLSQIAQLVIADTPPEYLQMSWELGVSSVVAYNVQYSTVGGGWITPSDSPLNAQTTQYVFLSTVRGGTYLGRVQAVDSFGNTSVWVQAGPYTVGE